MTDYDELMKEPWLEQLVERINKGTREEEQRKLKSKLPFRCPHYYCFADNHRDRKHLIPEAFTFATCIDIDDINMVQKAIDEATRLDIEAGGPWQGHVLRMEYSARKKLHIDILLPIGMTIEEAQRAFCEALGVPYDKACITPERLIYITPKSYEIYCSDAWYQPLSDDEVAQRRQAYLDRGLTIDGRKPDGTTPAVQAVTTPEAGAPAVQLDAAELHHTERLFKGIPYTTIIKEWFRRTGGEPVQGERNDRLHQLASHLRYITDNNEATLLELLPRYGLSEAEMRQLIHSACQRPLFTKPRVLQEILDDLTAELAQQQQEEEQLRRQQEQKENGQSTDDDQSELNSADWINAPQPPQMPRRLPKLIKLLTSKAPDIYKPAIAHAVFPPLGAHLYKTTFRYIDNVPHEATLMNVLMAGTGAGKDCIKNPINFIMADIRERDAVNIERLNAYKEEEKRKSANERGKDRPKGLLRQEMGTNITHAGFVLQTQDSEDHFLYAHMNEIDQLNGLKDSDGRAQQFLIICLAFDPENRYGVGRASSNSVEGFICVRFNFNASTTIFKGQKYFAKVLTDGPVNRINFCTIPEREIGAEIPVYGEYDDAFAAELKPYIDQLNGARGEIACKEAFQLAKKLNAECAEFARLSQSRVFENFSHRGNVIAYLKACILYVANGYKWDKTMENFIRWSLRYDLWCKMHFFGKATEKAEGYGAAVANTNGPRNILLALPDVFTKQEAVSIRRQEGKDEKGTDEMLRNWRRRGYIEIIEEENGQRSVGQFGQLVRYRKLKYFTNQQAA